MPKRSLRHYLFGNIDPVHQNIARMHLPVQSAGGGNTRDTGDSELTFDKHAFNLKMRGHLNIPIGSESH